MRAHLYNTSRAKNRTRIPKYYRRATTNISEPSTQCDIESTLQTTRERRNHLQRNASSDNVFYHHHQHHHNYYLPRSPHTPGTSPTNNCDIKKFLIYAILFFVAYYLLFIAITTTYRQNIYNKNMNKPILPDRIEIVTASTNQNTQKTLPHPFQKLPSKHDKDPEAERVAALKQILDSRTAGQASQQIAERRARRRRHRQEVRKLKPFSQLYVSDAPYYLNTNLVIIGLVCDAEKRIDMMLYQLESIGCLFNSTSFIIFESNSKDKTLLHLERWSLRKALNCSQIGYNPTQKRNYNDILTLNEMKQKIYVDDDMIYDYLELFDSLAEISLKDMSTYVENKLRMLKFEEIEIEEILAEKLAPIKYIKYRENIRKHDNTMYKTVLSGDDIVEDKIEIETEILRQIGIYGSLNELHSGYNVMDPDYRKTYSYDDDDDSRSTVDENGELVAVFMDDDHQNELDMQYNFVSAIKREQLKRHSHSDFVEEFGGIHEEIEGLIQYDEAIIHEKLRERKRKYEERRRKERAKREAELNGNNKGDEEETDEEETDEEEEVLRDSLFRIERFVIYRNMLLNETRRLSAKLGINFDYLLVVDLDIYSMDIRTFMNELYFMPRDVDGLCVDGMDWMGFTRDTFATVKANGGWLHYGHDPLVNKTAYIYNNEHAMQVRESFPDQKYRFESVKSCFGGLMMYKNEKNRLFEQECKYTLTRDIFWSQNINYTANNMNNNNSFSFNYTYDWWLMNRHHNAYSKHSEKEIKLFIENYIELLQVFDKSIENRELIPKDGDICEHIPYHYCLYDKGFKFAISTRAKLYYDKFYPIHRNDTNWERYLKNRPKFTL